MTSELQQEAERLARAFSFETLETIADELFTLLTERERLRKELEEANKLKHEYRSFLYGCDVHKLWQGLTCIGCLQEERDLLLSQHRLLVEVARAAKVVCEHSLIEVATGGIALKKAVTALTTHPTILKNFKRVLKQWRVRNGLTQEDAIKILGGNINTYRGWEQGKHEPSEAFQKAIAGLLSK